MRLLLVKLSSLGDVVHALPAVTDAVRARAGLEVHWVVEEAYEAIPTLHPAVTRVIPVALRRWRRQWRGAAAQIRQAITRLRESSYDIVIDAQGLIKSSVVARVARGPRAGFDRASVRERPASLLYQRGVAVAKAQHAIDRQRALFAGALDYAVPRGAIDYGVRCEIPAGFSMSLPAGVSASPSAGPLPRPREGLVLLHGSTWGNKLWPEQFWAQIAKRALDRGECVTLPSGSVDERRRAQRIAALAPGAEVSEALDLRGIIELLVRSAAVVSVDSGIGHLAAALGVPTLALYGPTDAALTGCRGRAAINLASDFSCAPCRKRGCGYRGNAVFVNGERIEPPCFSRITPELVWERLQPWALPR